MRSSVHPSMGNCHPQKHPQQKTPPSSRPQPGLPARIQRRSQATPQPPHSAHQSPPSGRSQPTPTPAEKPRRLPSGPPDPASSHRPPPLAHPHRPRQSGRPAGPSRPPDSSRRLPPSPEVIEGNSSQNVSQAVHLVKNVPEQAVEGPSVQYSHFISLPLAIHPDLVEKLYHFQKSVLGEMFLNADEVNVDKSIFIRPATFHLTVLMLKLWNKDRIAAAFEVLQSVSSKVKDALMLMKGSPTKAKILYAPVLEVGGEGRLLRTCEVIRDSFIQADLVDKIEAKRELKLHATVMNTNQRRTKDRKEPTDDFFDARRILSVHGKQDWGQYRLSEVHLSQRFKYDDNGYYHCCSSFPLP